MTHKVLFLVGLLLLPMASEAQRAERGNASLAMSMLGVPVATLIAKEAVSVDGDVDALSELLGLLDNFDFWFNIVTP